MADYPAFPLLRDSSAKHKDGIQIDRAQNGTARGRSLWVSSKRTRILKHILSDADLASLEAFYAANRAAVITLDGRSYLMDGPPQSRQVTPQFSEVTVSLEEV